jgi:hypothetical protein
LEILQIVGRVWVCRIWSFYTGLSHDSGNGLSALLGYDASGKSVSFDFADKAGLLIVTGSCGSF